MLAKIAEVLIVDLLIAELNGILSLKQVVYVSNVCAILTNFESFHLQVVVFEDFAGRTHDITITVARGLLKGIYWTA